MGNTFLGRQPAFPTNTEQGMTYRQWLIGLALQGLLADPELNLPPEDFARKAIDVADALLARLAEEAK